VAFTVTLALGGSFLGVRIYEHVHARDLKRAHARAVAELARFDPGKDFTAQSSPVCDPGPGIMCLSSQLSPPDAAAELSRKLRSTSDPQCVVLGLLGKKEIRCDLDGKIDSSNIHGLVLSSIEQQDWKSSVELTVPGVLINTE